MNDEQIKRRDELVKVFLIDHHERRISRGLFYHDDNRRELLNHEDYGIKIGFKHGYDAGFADSKAKITELTRKLEVAKKALGKYANEETHSMDEHGFTWGGDYFDYETARAALKELE